MTSKTQEMFLNALKPNQKNPRIIRDDRFKKLVKSLKDFPEMSKIRPVVVNGDMEILGGNMRFRAMQEAGWKTCTVTITEGLTLEQQNEFVIKDNVPFGEWDFDMLSAENEIDKLLDYGFEEKELGIKVAKHAEDALPDRPEDKVLIKIFQISAEDWVKNKNLIGNFLMDNAVKFEVVE